LAVRDRPTKGERHEFGTATAAGTAGDDTYCAGDSEHDLEVVMRIAWLGAAWAVLAVTACSETAEPGQSDSDAGEPDTSVPSDADADAGGDADGVIDASTATAYNFYVAPAGSDSNPGTQAQPFRTIQRAASAVVPDSTVHVAPGTYAEVIRTTVSGTATKRIRYVSDVKWAAKIVPVAGAYAMWMANGGYTDIDGFEVNGTGSRTIRIGVALSGGKSSVRNSLVHHVAENSGCDNQGGAGLHASQSRGPTFDRYDFIGNIVHHVGAGCGWIQGIYHQSSGNIKNNIVYAASTGINLYHDDHDVNVVNNTLFGNAGYGINFGGCQEAYNNGCPTSGIKVSNNIIYDNRGGIAGPVLAADVGNKINNNLVYGNTNNYDLASPSSSSRTGEVNAPPNFVNYVRTGGGDYHLRADSQAKDRGALANAPSTDLEGKPRPYGSGIDIGAYEWRP
jgi:hypothetical protein